MGVMDSKREWRAFQARVKALPQDYRIVYQAIQKYWFKVASGAGVPLTAVGFTQLLTLLEAGAARHEDVLALTGDDIAAFADGFLPE
ncbi:DUF1048 domain-containing protein [Lacticaseibacillus sp. GG6-2]